MNTPLPGLVQTDSGDVRSKVGSDLQFLLRTVCSLYEELAELQSQRDLLASRLAARDKSEKVIVNSFRNFPVENAIGTALDRSPEVPDEPLESVFARAGFFMRPVKKREQ
jgi:hypothetical protein